MALAAVESASPRFTPASRRGLVPRTRLVRRLMAASDTPLVLVLAPAGYGKTAVVTEWAACERRPFVWVRLSDVNNDPHRLLSAIDTAYGNAELSEADTAVLVFDGADALTSSKSLEVVARLAGHQSPGSQLVLVSRTEPRLGLGALRAQRKLLELRSADLAMDAAEAAALLHAHGFELHSRELELLVQRTEGWPAGLYLAALAARGEAHPARALAEFAGDDRFVADYIADELLSGLSSEQASFLARSSLLDDLSGPVCDFVLERDDSARVLKALSRMNLMIVPLDRSDAHYRYHRLFAQALRGELRRCEPEAEAALHRRASDWYDEHHDAERAIQHAMATGDASLAGERLWSYAAGMLGYGQTGQLDRWIQKLTDHQVATHPKLALTAAANALFAGDRTAVERWTSSALLSVDHARAGERATLQAHAILLRAAVAEDRAARMGAKAEAACSDVPEDSPWFALGLLLQGVGQHMTGDREGARTLLEDGARHAAAGFPCVQSLCLAQLALLAIERGDWAAAESLAARAKAQVERSGLQRYATSALVYAVSADVHAHLGRVQASQADARGASALLHELVDFALWYQAECEIALARAALRLSEASRARTLLSDAGARLERSPDSEAPREWIEACQAQADHSPSSSQSGGWCLTTAELRVLQFLPTHLSFPEVAERLYVSANTVKTHARSVYRKLGASSRGEAVAIARESGLLDEASHTGVAAAGLS